MRNRVAKSDFLEESLPKNRKELFRDIFKNHWRSLLAIAALLFVGALPYIACIVLRDLAALSYSMQLAAGNIDEAMRESLVRTVYFYSAIGETVSLFIFSIPLAGFLRILRQFAWLEPVFFKEDFRQGLKDNYKNCAITSIVVGLLLIGTKAMNFTAFNNVYLISAIVGLFIVLILPPFFLAIAQGTVYSGSFIRFHKNGMVLYLKHAIKVALFTLLLVSPFLMEMVQDSIVAKYIGVLLAVYFIPVVAILAFLLLSYSIFDVEINQEQFKDIYRKGLYTPAKKKKSKRKNYRE